MPKSFLSKTLVLKYGEGVRAQMGGELMPVRCPRHSGWSVGERLVDGLVQVAHVGHLRPVVRRHDEDRRRMAQANALAQRAVRDDLTFELPRGVHHKRHLPAMLLEVAALKALKVVLRCDGHLVGEDRATEVLSGLGIDLVLNVAR